MNRREFLGTLAAAAACGAPLGATRAQVTQSLYDLPPFGNVSLLHFTDCHAQLLPTHFREPSANIGVGDAMGRFPHLVGEHLLRSAGIAPGTPQAHAFTYLDFAAAAKRYGKIGGFAHMATLVKQLKASRPAGQTPARQPPQCFAARWRRHLAGFGDIAVDAWRGHDSGLSGARRGHDDRALGIHLRR